MARLDAVLISGAGIAGLALARALRAQGTRVEVLERRPAAEAQGAGILLTGNAVRVLQNLGLEPALLERGRRVHAIRFTDELERELFAVDCAGRRAWPPFFSIQRGALLRILLDGASPVVPRWGTTLLSLRECQSGTEVAFSDGTHGRYDLVVGADGVHSQLRTLLFQGQPPQPIAGVRGWRFLAKCPAGLDAPQYMIGNGRTLLLHPLAGGEVYCGAGPVVDSAVEGAGDLERMRDAFRGFGGFARQVLASADASTPLHATRYWHVAQRPWHAGHCVLLGDAAHACAPTLAQGAAMALEDALVLDELLASHESVATALPAFEQRRAERVTRVQALSLQRMAANRHVDAREAFLRNSIAAKVGAAQLLDAWAPLMEALP